MNWPLYKAVANCCEPGVFTDEQVADGERRDEVVGRLADRALEHERQQDDEIAGDRDEADAGCQHGQQGRLPRPQHADQPGRRQRPVYRRPVFTAPRVAVLRLQRRHHGVVVVHDVPDYRSASHVARVR